MCVGGGEVSEKGLVCSSFPLVVFSIKNSQLLIRLVSTVYGNSPQTKRNVGSEGCHRVPQYHFGEKQTKMGESKLFHYQKLSFFFTLL